MKTFIDWIPYIIIAIELFSFILSIICGNTKNKKVKNACTSAMDFIIKLKEYIVQVEKFENLSGAQKEMFVLAMLKSDAEKLNLTETQLKEMIASEISFTKEVNYNGK